MARMTRNVDLQAVRDLLERPPRAHLAFNLNDSIAALPVAFRYSEGYFWVGIPRSTELPPPGAPVTLLIDDGCYWFELRAIKMRGTLHPGSPPEGASSELTWLQLAAQRTVAWDYASLREDDRDAP
jgi:hypothetical protein